MGIIDRILLVIYTLILISLSVVIVLLAGNLLPLDLVWTSLVQIPGQWEFIVGGVLLFVVSARLLFAGVRTRRRARDTIIHSTDMGDVHVSLSAVESLVERITRQAKGVRSAKVQVKAAPEGIFVYIKASVSPESNIPEAGAQIQERVHDYIKNTVGVKLGLVRVLVDDISTETKARPKVE